MRMHGHRRGGLHCVTLLGLTLSSGCVSRPSEEHSEFAVEFARRFCAVQANCECRNADPVPDCENVVESIVGGREAEAKRDGQFFDETCAEQVLERADWLGTCAADPQDDLGGPYCPVYTKDRDVGDECRVYWGYPGMSDCRAGLSCNSGTCIDPDDPRLGALGEPCGGPPIEPGHPNGCAPGLICDLIETGTCAALPPAVATGGLCTSRLACRDGDYCRGQTPDDLPSDAAPGICTPATTPLNASCEHFLECEEYWCINGICSSGEAPLCYVLDDFAAVH